MTQRFATVHIEGVSLLRVVLEYVGLNDGTCLGFRVIIENRREEELDELARPEPEMVVRFFPVERQAEMERQYHDAYAWGMRLSGVMECDYLDRAIPYLSEED